MKINNLVKKIDIITDITKVENEMHQTTDSINETGCITKTTEVENKVPKTYDLVQKAQTMINMLRMWKRR